MCLPPVSEFEVVQDAVALTMSNNNQKVCAMQMIGGWALLDGSCSCPPVRRHLLVGRLLVLFLCMLLMRWPYLLTLHCWLPSM
jgi:hypothetical protein